ATVMTNPRLLVISRSLSPGRHFLRRAASSASCSRDRGGCSRTSEKYRLSSIDCWSSGAPGRGASITAFTAPESGECTARRVPRRREDGDRPPGPRLSSKRRGFLNGCAALRTSTDTLCHPDGETDRPDPPETAGRRRRRWTWTPDSPVFRKKVAVSLVRETHR